MELTSRRILYEDGELLAIDKPAGLVAHATVDPARDHLVAAVERLLVARDGQVGHLRLQHRLDRDTSGVVLFSRSPSVDAALGAMFAERRVDKTYLALVRGAATAFPSGTTELRAYLAEGRGAGGRTRVVRAGGRPAVTQVRALLAADSLLLVEARPRSGRAHQIRVQLAELGFPIVGDALYGERDPTQPRALLHALRLAFDHPRSGERCRIVAPAPADFESRVPGLASRLAALDEEDGGGGE